MSFNRGLYASLAFALLLFGVDLAKSAQDTITLGAALSLTGEHAVNGTNTRNGYDLAVRQINRKGGVRVGRKTYQLNLRSYDDESTPARGTELVERLIRQDGVRFILGPYSARETKAILPLVESHRVPMIEANGAASGLFTKGYRYIFGVLSAADQYLRPAIDLATSHAEKFGKRPQDLTLALVVADDPFALSVHAGVVAAAKEHGINRVIDDRLSPERDDMSMTLTKVKALKPDMLFVSGHELTALTAVEQIDALQVHVPMIALTHCESAEVAKNLAKASSYIFCAQQWHRSLKHKGDLFGAAEDFAQLFEKIYGYEPPYQAAQSAAAVYVFANALERSQSLDAGKVRDAIATTDLRTFFGPIKFDESGKNIAKPMILTQIIDGNYIVVSPAEWAQQEPVIPRPRQ